MSDERRPTINIYAAKHRGKTAEAKRREGVHGGTTGAEVDVKAETANTLTALYRLKDGESYHIGEDAEVVRNGDQWDLFESKLLGESMKAGSFGRDCLGLLVDTVESWT